MWSRDQIQSYANEVASFVEQHVAPAVHFLASNKTAVGIEAKLPQGAKIIEALGGADKAIGIAMGTVPYVGEAFALYETYKALGGRPMDQAGFDALEEARGRQE